LVQAEVYSRSAEIFSEDYAYFSSFSSDCVVYYGVPLVLRGLPGLAQAQGLPLDYYAPGSPGGGDGVHLGGSVNNAEGLAPALRAGLGLALQPEFRAWEDLQSGALQTCMDDWQVPSIALHIVTPPGRARPARDGKWRGGTGDSGARGERDYSVASRASSDASAERS
jgi:DNA-binding transcriptional LysR family regulator